MVDSQSILHVLQALLSEEAGEEMELHFIDKDTEHAVIWAKDSAFPLDILNTGCPSDNDFSGDPEIVKFIHEMQKNGYKVQFISREQGDETDFEDVSHQDFKLVINS